jgi:hypothetical protein
MKTIIIVDIDGTLANVKHRVLHVQKKPPDWKSFNELILSQRDRGRGNDFRKIKSLMIIFLCALQMTLDLMQW